jgi:CRP-like cAMP-binding protein
LPVNEFLQVRGAQNAFAAGDCAATTNGATAFEARREIRMGRRAAYNALALHRGYKLRPWAEKTHILTIAALGRYATVARFLGINFSGIPAWVAGRAMCLLNLPGLERNLRVLVDWIMDIPFRNDIVTLAPQPTQKLGRAHYEPGDVIVREGEAGDCAYLVNRGELQVLKQDGSQQREVAKLKSGDCFGEIALLADVPRTATVRCITAVDVLILPRGEFMTLAEGYREFGSAIRARLLERMPEQALAQAQSASVPARTIG